jgi:hypothetical protein
MASAPGVGGPAPLVDLGPSARGDGHREAFARERSGDRATETAAAARDERDTSHGLSAQKTKNMGRSSGAPDAQRGRPPAPLEEGPAPVQLASRRARRSTRRERVPGFMPSF